MPTHPTTPVKPWTAPRHSTSLSTSLPPSRRPVLTVNRAPSCSPSKKVARFLQHGIANATRNSYSAAWNNYERFAILRNLPILPVTYETLSKWMADTLDSGRAKPETIEGYLIGIKNRHVEEGLPTDVFNDPHLKRILRRAVRLLGPTPIRERGEIERPLLLAMLNSLSNTFDHVNLRAAFTIAFAAFLRAGELTWSKWNSTDHTTHLSRGSVTFLKDGTGVLLHLPCSKTDPLGKGTIIPLAPADDIACPVSSLRTLFTRYPRPATDPLFSRLVGPFDRDWFEISLKQAILYTGRDPSTFSGHSFRRGAANSAIAAGIPKDEVKELGRWKSSAIDRYITPKSSVDLRLAANRKLHTHLASSSQRAPLSSGRSPFSSTDRRPRATSSHGRHVTWA